MSPDDFEADLELLDYRQHPDLVNSEDPEDGLLLQVDLRKITAEEEGDRPKQAEFVGRAFVRFQDLREILAGAGWALSEIPALNLPAYEP